MSQRSRLISFVLYILVGCGGNDPASITRTVNESTTTLPVGSSRIATMNMRWLNDQLNTGIVPRTAADYGAIANVLVNIDAAIIGIQEVENVSAVQNLIINSHLIGKPYSVITNGEGAQEIGVFWNTAFATVSSMSTPAGFSGFTRTPLFVAYRVGDFDGTLVVIHLKAGTDSVSKSRRAAEMGALQSWALSYLANTANDPDLLILGDFNFNPRSGEINISSQLSLYAPTPATLVSGSNTVDLVIASPDTIEEVLPNSTSVGNTGVFYQLYNSYAVSDHWPVKIEINGATGTRDK
ncbi:MAG: endonuclease/exonuclease/phosphatase family protein [Bdellovibrionota bacterium]